MTISTKAEVPRALLVSVQTPDVNDETAQASLAELGRLVTTLGFTVIGTERQRQPTLLGATAVGAGKLREIAKRTTGGTPTETPEAELASVVVFDCELKPSQLRHIENRLGVEVMDRTGVIIEIFSRHAKTRAARLEVEIARLNYLSPRLREVGSSGERQSGRGAGESALETERRSIRDRLAGLKKELTQLQREQAGKREARSELHTVALVGYTNAGKSSLMRALTGSDVLVEDKLFATLDTTVRAIKPETLPRILASDTVGFIKKLPHDLVASFQSTLEEAKNALLLLYVVDAADPDFRTQMKVVEATLREVGVTDTPVILVLNKIDQVDEAGRKILKSEFPDATQLSTRSTEDVSALRARIQRFFEREMKDEEIFVPYRSQGAIGEIRAKFRVLRERHEEEGTRIRVRGLVGEIERLKRKFQLIGEPA